MKWLGVMLDHGASMCADYRDAATYPIQIRFHALIEFDRQYSVWLIAKIVIIPCPA